MNKKEMAMKLSAKLPPITAKQRKYAKEHCFDLDSNCAIRRGKSKVHCLECGGTFDIDAPQAKNGEFIGNFVCPHCGKEVAVWQSSSRYARKEYTSTLQVVTSISGVAVIRTWYVTKRTFIDKPATYEFNEAHQIFIFHKLGEVVVARPRLYSFYIDKFDYNRPMAPKKITRDNFDVYHINAEVVYPIVRLPEIVKRNGWSKQLLKYNISTALRRLLTMPHYETLVKAKRFSLYEHLSEDEIDEYWPQIKMLLRHNYYPESVRIWVDTVKMAKINGFDTRSPKYVLPEKLGAMHNYLAKKDLERRRREDRERMKERDEQFKKSYGLLLGFSINEKDITIKPLQDAAEFNEEGDKMHHCVASYFDRRDSFILSAKSHGKRIATIELDRKNFKVKQCRAKFNEKPERYDELLGILAAHRKDLRKIGRKQDRQTKELTA